MVEYDGMNFSRHAEAGHSDPFLVSGGYQGNPLRERRTYDFKGKEDSDHQRVCQIRG